MSGEARVTRACWQPWESLNVAADGKVYPCCVVAPALEVGDLNHQSLDEIVAGEPMLRVKTKLLMGDIADLGCLQCPNAPMQTLPEFHASLVLRYGLWTQAEPAAPSVPAAGA